MNWIKKIIEIIKNWFTKKPAEENKIKQPQVPDRIQTHVPAKPQPEELNQIIIGSDKNSVILDRINNFTFDQQWTPLGETNENANFFSQVIGAGTAAGSAAFSASGLYRATVSPDKLMTYNNGTLSSITLNGKSFGSHAGFVNANAAVFSPILLFQFASMITGQYYFNGMTKQLTSIQQGISQLLQNHHNERTARMRAYAEKMIEFEKRSFFTAEDFVNIDKMKLDLAVIRYEYLLSAHQELKGSLFPEKAVNDAPQNYDETDLSSAEKLKIAARRHLNEIKSEIRSLYKDSDAETFLSAVGNFFQNSGSRAEKLVQKINGSKFFFMLEAALHADKLYQYIHFLELKANLSYKNPDENRIGKIDHLRQSVYNFNPEKDSVLSEVNSTAENLNREVAALLDHYNDNSYFNQTEITAKKAAMTQQFKKIEKYKDSNAEFTGERAKIREAFETPIDFVIDNREGKGTIYIKKLDK